MTADQILSIDSGTRIQMNYDVHMVTGADPSAWCPAQAISRVTHRGETAVCHPKGPGLPFVMVQIDSPAGGYTSFVVGVGDQHIRIAA